MNRILYYLNLVRRHIEKSNLLPTRLLNAVMQIFHWCWLSTKYKSWNLGQWLNCMYTFMKLTTQKQMYAREYFSYNLQDCQNRKKQFAHYSHKEFMTVFQALNVFGYGSKHSPLIGDKLAMNRFFQGHGLPTPQILAQLDLFGKTGGRTESEPSIYSIHDLEAFLIDSREIQDHGFVIKPRFGTGGYGVFIFSGYDAGNRTLETPDGNHLQLDEFIDQIKSANMQKTLSLEMYEPGTFILQKRINQHHATAKWHPQSSNTFRIFSINGNKGTEVFFAILKTGAGRNTMDNFSQGGVAVQIEIDTGKLWPEGCWPQDVRTVLVRTHPDTGLEFAGEIMPMWEKVLLLIERGHALLMELPTIGWDIAMSKDGPMAVEINSITQLARCQIFPGFNIQPEYFREHLL